MDAKQESYKRRVRLRRKRRAQKLLKMCLVLALLAGVGALAASVAIPALERLPDQEETQLAAKTTAVAEKGTLQKTVFGSGAVQPASQPGVYAEVDATVAQTLVGLGDEVKAGDVLMKLESASMTQDSAEAEAAQWNAQENVQDTETYDRYRYEVMLDEVTGRPMKDSLTGQYIYEQYSNALSIRSPCNGKVVAVYIEEGDDALAVYRDKGAVILISTDGCMKVSLDVNEGVELELGQKVTVKGSGFRVEGTVVNLARRGTQAEIRVDSDEYPVSAKVSVATLEGAAVGESTLEINKPMAVSAYGGIIAGVSAYVGQTVKREDVLATFTWSGTPLYLDNASVLLEYAKSVVATEEARALSDALVVTAPCDGKVATIDVSNGDSVSDGTQLLSIVEDAGMELILSVDELDIVYVEVGQQAVMELDALADVTITGTVEKIAPLGNTDSSVTTYDVYIALDEVDERVLGGMNVSGEIVVDTAEDALLIPMDPLGKVNGSYTVTLEDGTIRQVTVGIMTRDYVQILSGLSEGETVVY